MDTIRRRISFTIDVEEFDTALEHGYALPLNEQIAVSTQGMLALMGRLNTLKIPGTLFTTATYAHGEPALIRSLSQRHEIASHGYYHGSLEPGDLLASRLALEAITGQPVVGFRRAQMGPVDLVELRQAGYRYNASLHPTWLPGRYNHLDKPRLPFRQEDVWQIPASVTPRLRIPLFWLSLKNVPFGLYAQACRHTLRANGHLNLYVHPWEFADLSRFPRIPAFIRRRAGEPLLDRVERLLRGLAIEGEFQTMAAFCDQLSPQPLY